jgi:ribulose 1,5-bisphosphate synthetase/thiazole synthase
MKYRHGSDIVQPATLGTIKIDNEVKLEMKLQGRILRRDVLSGMVVAATAAALRGAQPQRAVKNADTAHTRYQVLDTVDVLVVGGGPAGIGAALAAARAGAKTLVIENHSFFGGVAAWSMGMQMNQMRPFGHPRSAVHELLIGKLQAYGDQAVKLGVHEVWSNVEYLKVAILEAFDAVGARYLVHVRAADVISSGNRVQGVVIATKRGMMAIRAHTVIDCSGDADVAFYAGAETLSNPESLMPMTLALVLSNIDPKTQRDEISTTIREGRKNHPLISSGFVEVKPVANSTNWWVNHAGSADWGRVDATDPLARSKAECDSRRQALQMVQALRESKNPNLSRAEWAAAGPQVSVRETRRIKGVYTVSEDDAMSGRTFDDAVAWRAGFLDQGGEKDGRFVKMKVHDVPYRSLLPEKVDGLLVAGRCISATHTAAAAGKSMGNCMALGHAAGVAAALSARSNIQPRELSVAELRDRLRADGVSFDVADREQKQL